MLSTLFLLMLSGILLQGVIKISTNHIIQLNQLSSAYQAKTALNMSERLLKEYIIENNYDLPEEVDVSSSVGQIRIIKKRKDGYEAVITQKNGVQFTKKIAIEMIEDHNEEREDSNDSLNKEFLRPAQEENIIFD